MSREIKFRVRWIHPESDCEGFDYFDVLEGYKQGDVSQEIVDITQYTGLKDIKGIGIYEGDILKVNGYYFGDSFIPPDCGVVRYHNGGFYIDYEFSPEFCEENIDNYNIEKIGNVYEDKGGY